MSDVRSKYRVRVPGYDYYRELVNCQFHCPVNTDARGYVKAIAAGDYERAYIIARESNPLASICGRVCGAPCEAACRRGRVDEAVSIRALKRFVTEQYGTEAGTKDGKAPAILATRPERRDSGFDVRTFRDRSGLRDIRMTHGGKRIAVVGSGPAGLSAAHDLAVMGYKVTLFEAQSVPGGMLILGIPEYRLSRELIRAEIRAILDLGVSLRLNCALGRDFDLDQLRAWGFDAVFLAIGAHLSRSLRIEGVEYDGVLRAIDFLLNVNMGYKVDMGRRVLVIGGGNVAVDVARSALRKIGPAEDLGPDELRAVLRDAQAALQQVAQVTETQPDEMKVAIDAARSALRLGVKEVQMVCLESRREMPADKVEIEEAVEEGIRLINSKGPKRILGENGKATGVEFLDVASVFDANGRFNPTFKPDTESIIHADTVIMAIGQASDLSFLKEGDGIQLTARGNLQVDPDTMATTAPGIYAGGDLAFGPRLIINAVADGQKAARSIAAYLEGGRSSTTRRAQMVAVRPSRTESLLFPDCMSLSREKVPARPIERRIGIAEVELGFDPAAAERQARRCLNCGVHPVFNGEMCVLCGGCVDVCPERCLKLVAVDRISGEEDLADLLRVRCGAAGGTGNDGAQWSAMLKDEEKCLRCGLCAERCPTGAITMEFFQFREQLVLQPGGEA